MRSWRQVELETFDYAPAIQCQTKMIQLCSQFVVNENLELQSSVDIEAQGSQSRRQVSSVETQGEFSDKRENIEASR